MRRPFGLEVLALMLVAAVVYGRHVFEGGLYSDDWALADVQQHYPDAGYITSVEANHELLGNRPLYSVLAPLGFALFGDDARWHLVYTLVLAVLVAFMTRTVLQRLGMPRGPALGIALLVLLFPWAASPRLWPSAAIAQVAILLLLLGLLAALRGLGLGGARGAAWHALALTAYVASALVYETTAPAILAIGSLYLLRAARRPALRRWTTDALVGIGTLAWSSSASHKDRLPIGDWFDRLPDYAWTFGREAVSLVIRSILLVEDPAWLQAVAGLVIALFVLLGLRLAWRLGPEDPARRPLRVWLGIGAGALVALPVVWGPFMATAYWTPLRPGLESRVNVLAAVPLAVLAVAWMMVAAHVLARRTRGRLGPARVGLVLAGALVAGYGIRMHVEVHRWDRAAGHAREVLGAIASLPRLPSGTTIYTFGHIAEVAPRVPVFEDEWDLNGAARVVLDDATLRAYPVYSGSRLTCAADGLETSIQAPHVNLSDPAAKVYPGRPHFDGDPGARYGRIVFLDVPTRTHRMIDGRPACLEAVAMFEPGPKTG